MTLIESEIDAAEYAISTGAFDLAVAWEIEFAEVAAYEAKIAARALVDKTKNVVRTPVKFEVGKTYTTGKLVLFDNEVTITILKRTDKFIHFIFEDGELDETIYKRKVKCDYGVETLYFHETNALGGDYNFDARNVVDINDEFDADNRDRDDRINRGERHADIAAEKFFNQESVTVESCANGSDDDKPTVTAEDREEMNAAVRKFAHAMKDNYEQYRRAEQIKAQAPVAELTGNITVDSGAKAFALVGEYFPNGLTFQSRTEDTNGADEFTFTDGGEMFLHATCTPDNRRIEYLEVINTDYSAGKRKPLSVTIKPPAHVDEEFFFGQGTVTVKSPAEAMALIELVARDKFEFYRESSEVDFDENKPVNVTRREFRNVHNMEPAFGTFTFSEIFRNGELERVDFQKGFNLGAKTVKIFVNEPKTPDTVEVAEEFNTAVDELKADGYKFSLRTHTIFDADCGIQTTTRAFKTIEQAGKAVDRYVEFAHNNPAHAAGYTLTDIDGSLIDCSGDGFNRDEFGNCDFSYNIYGVLDAGLTEAEIAEYANKIRDALSESGNLCRVDAEENLIGIDANAGGNIKKFLEIVRELYQRDCFPEFDRIVDEYESGLQQEVGGYEWAWLESLCTDNPLPRPNQYGDEPVLTVTEAS